MMGTPHKHAAVIKAWADGAEIEWCCVERGFQVWSACPNPTWNEKFQYRVKPPTLRYRIALFQHLGGPAVIMATFPNQEADWQCEKTFVRWVTDWITVEV